MAVRTRDLGLDRTILAAPCRALHRAVAMHELALMDGLVSAVGERIPEGRITAVRIEVGLLAAVLPDALRFCFDICTSGTRLEGATLDIREVSGHELRIKEVEVI